MSLHRGLPSSICWRASATSAAIASSTIGDFSIAAVAAKALTCDSCHFASLWQLRYRCANWTEAMIAATTATAIIHRRIVIREARMDCSVKVSSLYFSGSQSFLDWRGTVWSLASRIQDVLLPLLGIRDRDGDLLADISSR
jgi:hypothetical protein